MAQIIPEQPRIAQNYNNIINYIGIQYISKGRDRNKGLDCWGLVLDFYLNEFGIKLPSFEDRYISSDDQDSVHSFIESNKKELIAKGEWAKVTEPQFGDVVLCKIKGINLHTGIVIEENKMLHILRGHNSVVERTNSMNWKHRIEGYYRWIPQ